MKDCSSSEACCVSVSVTSASVKFTSDTFCKHTWMYFLWGKVKGQTRLNIVCAFILFEELYESNMPVVMWAHLLPAESRECLVLKGM